MSRLLPLEEVRVCDLRSEARAKFTARFAGSPFRLVDCPDREAACRGADVIVTVTTADEPLVEEPWVKKGALVMTMGSYTETSDDVCLRADRLLADHLGQAMHRGNFKALVDRGALTAASFAAELTEVVAGRKRGRGAADERIVLALVGMGCLDLSIASLAYERIVASGEQVLAVDLGG
jgi:ornithine cyclodeaminase/alanine dehydrogenase